MGSSPNLSVTWTTSAYKTKSTYNYSINDTNVWQSQTTTIPMTPTCGSHEQLQYSGHQHVAVIDNSNTEDTNMWQSETTTVLMTPTSGSHRQFLNEQLSINDQSYIQYLQLGPTVAHDAQSPRTNIKAITVHIKEWRVHPMKLRKVS